MNIYNSIHQWATALCNAAINIASIEGSKLACAHIQNRTFFKMLDFRRASHIYIYTILKNVHVCTYNYIHVHVYRAPQCTGERNTVEKEKERRHICRVGNNSQTSDIFWPFHHAFVWSKDSLVCQLCLSNNLHITFVHLSYIRTWCIL